MSLHKSKVPSQGEQSSKTIIIGHRDADGIYSAFVAKKATLESGQDEKNIIMIDAQYGEALPNVEFDGNDVIIVDFSYSREILLDLNERANSLEVIDHHQTAQENCKGLDFCTFDMSRAGVTLTWNHFYPLASQITPDVLLYVEDRDLYKLALPENRAYMTVVNQFRSMNDENYQEFLRLLDNDYFHAQVGADARAIAKYEEEQIERLASYWRWIYIDGHKIPAVNCRMWLSDVCAVLYKKFPDVPFVATYFDTPPKVGEEFDQEQGIRVYNLRSAEHGADVSKIAKKFGGGGHYHASGFSVPLVG